MGNSREIAFHLSAGGLQPLARVEAGSGVGRPLKHMNKSNARFRGRGQSREWRLVAEYERELRRGFSADHVGPVIEERGLVVSVELELGDQITKSGARRTGKARARQCDVDGVKAILDAMNGIVWKDDQQIGTLFSCKRAREGLGDRVVVSVFRRA